MNIRKLVIISLITLHHVLLPCMQEENKGEVNKHIQLAQAKKLNTIEGYTECPFGDQSDEVLQLLEAGETFDKDCLTRAVAHNKIRMVILLLSAHTINPKIAKVSRDEKDVSCGYTPLYWATNNNSAKIARMLLQQGASVNVCCRPLFGGGSPLHKAVEKDYVDVAKVLLEFKADTELKDASGKDALTVAREHGSKEVAELLEKFKK